MEHQSGSGREKRELRIVNPDPRWPDMFLAERDRILEAAPHALRLDVQHIGSTSVPGLCAKSIIDIGMGLDRHEDGRQLIGPLQSLGYTYRGQYGIPGRHYFVKGEPRTFQIHAFARDHDSLRDMLAFRDALRADPVLRNEYAKLKRAIVAAAEGDRTRYQNSKADFISAVVRAARS